MKTGSIIVVGIQWGDEGKGKVIDLLSEKASFVVRAQGGNNAGHTIMIGLDEYKFHLIPSGILYPHVTCGVAGGTVIDPRVLLAEISGLQKRGVSLQGRLWISPYAHVIFPYHQQLDQLYEAQKGNRAIGTTGRGIGPCYADRALRIGIRICELIRPEVLRRRLTEVLTIKNQELEKTFGCKPVDLEALLAEYLCYGEQLAPFVGDVEGMVSAALDQKKMVLFEGAHGTLLDNLYGTYPFVTSSITLSAGVAAGAGIGATRIDYTIGVVKAYTTRVGAGPLPTALSDRETGLFINHVLAREVGTTTGRQRRMGWLDICLLRLSIRLNGVDVLAVTKLDILDDLEEIKICTGYRLEGKPLEVPPPLTDDLERVEPIYESMPGWKTPTRDIKNWEDLPRNARHYLERIASLTGVPIQIVSVGPERERTLFK